MHRAGPALRAVRISIAGTGVRSGWDCKSCGGEKKRYHERSSGQVLAWTIRLEEEVRKRGMIYHGVGHSWTCRALGMELSHWNPVYAPLTSEQRGMLAEVKGVRAMQWDRPMLTSLCFGRHDVRTRMVETVLEYAEQHPEVDLLHVWLDDGGNNKCECDICAERLPSDWYALMLNELDAALTARGNAMRIVFLGYSDLLWAPGADAPKLSVERFIFMYANGLSNPPLDASFPASSLPPYARNQTNFKRDLGEFLVFLQDWQRYFSGDSVLFEYYLCGAHAAVFDQYALARLIHGNIRQLGPLGINGMISCQMMRVFFPSGVAMYVMGQTLWDETIDLDATLDDYFYAACGKDSALCKEFLKVSTEELHRIVSFGGTLAIGDSAASHLAQLRIMLTNFAKVVERNLFQMNQCHARSWHYMRWYVLLLDHMLGIFTLMADGQPSDDVLAAWQATKDFLSTNEVEYHQVFDLSGFVSLFDNYLVNGRYNNAPEVVVQ